MAAESKRGLDWPTAWRVLVPVYGLAAALHAVLPLFAAPIWVMFFFYGRMVLDGARLAMDPWRGRGSPRPYLLSFALTMFAHQTAFAALQVTSSASVEGTATVGGIAALSCAALFVAASAPPGVRDRRILLRLGIGAEIAGAATVTAVLVGLPNLSEAQASVALIVPPLALAAVSLLAFLLAGRAGTRSAPSVARRAPKA